MTTRVLDNKKSGKVSEALRENIKAGAKLSVVSAYFTIYALETLKKELSKVEQFRFLYSEPSFIRNPKEEKREYCIQRANREKKISGNEYEIRLRNELTQSKIAKEFAKWIAEKGEFRSLIHSEAVNTRAIHVLNRDGREVAIQGADFTASGLGVVGSSKNDLTIFTDDLESTREMLRWFDEIWNNKQQVEDVKAEVLRQLQTSYTENTPELIYFATLYNIFKEYLDDLSEERIVKTKTGIKDTLIWKKLYKFQRDGVLGAIDKLERYNGCIIADSVGLGKTFEALAIIKYYELRNDRVLVLCPKKLRDNWTIFTVNARLG